MSIENENEPADPSPPRRRTRRSLQAAAVSAAATPASPTGTITTPKKRGRKATPKKDAEVMEPTTPATQESSATKKRKRKRKISSSSPAPNTVSPPKPKTKNQPVVEKDMSAPNAISDESKKKKKEYPPTLDARVHRLRHMGYIPGSISAFTSKSTTCGQLVVARTDGSYELKSVTVPPSAGSSEVNNYYPENSPIPGHRLITIAETPAVTGRKPVSEDASYDDGEESTMEDGNDGPELCPDSASSLCWCYPSLSTPVCIGSGPNGNLWIVDFKTARPMDIISSSGGGIFDLATMSSGDKTDNHSSNLPFIAAACEDGSVRMWKVLPGKDGQGQIQDPPVVTLPSAGAPVLSLVWRHVATLKQGKNRSSIQTVVFAAVADGTIRKYGLDIEEQSSGIEKFYSVPNPPKSILRMTVENKGRKDSTKVWTLLLLRDNTVVAGNSLGQVQFWNGETGTLTQTVIQSNSQADVLKLVVNSEETKIFCSGVDSRVVCLERKKPLMTTVAAQQSNATGSTNDLTALVTSHLTNYRPWKMTVSQRPHTHDVKAMAIVTSTSGSLSSAPVTETLLTGGVDTKICSYSISTFAQSQPQTWYPWPSATSLFSCATSHSNGNTKLVAMQRHDRVELYELEGSKNNKRKWNGQMLSAHESHKMVLAQHPTSIPMGTIALGGNERDEDTMPSLSSPLRACLLSPNGQFLAVSNMTSTYVFQLIYSAGKGIDDGPVRLKPRKLELPKMIQNVSATSFHFVGTTLYVGVSSGARQVHVLRLRPNKHKENDDEMDVGEDGEKRSTCKQTISLPESQPSNIGAVALPIQSIHANEEFLVTVRHERENAVHIFKRTDKHARYEHFWTLPNLGGGTDARPAAVTLLDGNKLAVATYRSQLYLFDIETRSLNKWSEQYGFPLKDRKWSEDSLCGRGYPVRLIPLPNDRLIMASFGSFCVIDLTKPIPRRCRFVPKRPAWKIRRKYKAVVHDDADDHEQDEENDDHWLRPRVTKVVEDEYSHHDPDAEDDDETEANALAITSPFRSASTKAVAIPHEVQDEELASRSCTICSHYKNILYTNVLGPKEMIVIEQPWLEIAETFPAALQRKIYGAE